MVGLLVGSTEGAEEGMIVGTFDGIGVGLFDGASRPSGVGWRLGKFVGSKVGGGGAMQQ